MVSILPRLSSIRTSSDDDSFNDFLSFFRRLEVFDATGASVFSFSILSKGELSCWIPRRAHDDDDDDGNRLCLLTATDRDVVLCVVGFMKVFDGGIAALFRGGSSSSDFMSSMAEFSSKLES